MTRIKQPRESAAFNYIFSFPEEKKSWLSLKRIDISNALSYIERVLANNKGDSKMDNKTKDTKNKVNIKQVFAVAIATPFIVMGVASLFSTNVPYAQYVVGALVAGFIAYIILEK